MPVFQYKAANTDGDVLEGRMEAGSQEAVIRRLHELGHIPIRADEVGASRPARRELGSFLHRGGITQRDVAEFTLELATLLEAGVALDKALEMLGNLTGKEEKRELLLQLHADVRGGTELSSALEPHERHFSRFYRNMIKAGEATGALGATLERLGEHLERSRELREAVVSALIYPVILVAVGCVSMVVILGFVIPRISSMFDQAGQALPWYTRVVIWSGELIQHYGWALAIVLVAAAFYVRRLLRDPAIRLRIDGWLLRLPLASELVTNLETARFARTLGTLLSGGVSMLHALAIAREVIANQVIANGIGRVTERVRRGEGLARPLREMDVLPTLAVHLIQVGEETGNLEKMLLRIGAIHERDAHTVLRRLMAVLEPAFIVVLAAAIAGIIISVVVPMFSINDLVF